MLFSQARLEELHRLWDLLMKRLAERGRRLQLALDLLQYLREAEELLYWISDKRNFVERQDLGRDLEHLEQIQVIVKKFEEFLQVRYVLSPRHNLHYYTLSSVFLRSLRAEILSPPCAINRCRSSALALALALALVSFALGCAQSCNIT